MKKLTKVEEVSLLMKHVPEVRHDYKLLLLLYWSIYDNIKIPDDIFNALLGATQPETISRAKRKALEGIRLARIDRIHERLEELHDICKEE